MPKTALDFAEQVHSQVPDGEVCVIILRREVGVDIGGNIPPEDLATIALTILEKIGGCQVAVIDSSIPSIGGRQN